MSETPEQTIKRRSEWHRANMPAGPLGDWHGLVWLDRLDAMEYENKVAARATLKAARDAVEALESGRMTAGKLTATELLTRMMERVDG